MNDTGLEEIKEHLKKLKRFNEWEREHKEHLELTTMLSLLDGFFKLFPAELRKRIRLDEYENLRKIREVLSVLKYDE